VDLSDFLPTLAGVMGTELPAEPVIDGRSFLPQLLGERGEPREWVRIYSNPRPEDPGRNPRVFFARDARYKLYDDGRFFDCDADPGELRALVTDRLSASERACQGRLQEALDSAPPEPAHLKRRD
jgi:arylsulfatase A